MTFILITRTSIFINRLKADGRKLRPRVCSLPDSLFFELSNTNVLAEFEVISGII